MVPENKRVKNVITFKVNNDDFEQLKDYAKRADKPQADVIREILFKKKLTFRYINDADTRIALKIDDAFEQYKKAADALTRISDKIDRGGDKEIIKLKDELIDILKEQEIIKELLYEISDEIKCSRHATKYEAENLK